MMSLSSSDRNGTHWAWTTSLPSGWRPRPSGAGDGGLSPCVPEPGKSPQFGRCGTQGLSLTERLVVDRASRTAEYLQDSSAGFTFSQKLQSGDVAELLDALEPDVIFGEIEGNPGGCGG